MIRHDDRTTALNTNCRQPLLRNGLYSADNIDSDVVCGEILLQCDSTFERAIFRDKTDETNLKNGGFAVVVNYLNNTREAEEAVAEIKRSGGEATAIKADVANATDVSQLFEETLKKFGNVDVVVQNSGIMPLSLISKGDVDLFDKVIATNLRGTFLVLSQAAQHIARGGRIIAFSSSVLGKSFPTYGPYIASKAGVEGLVHVLANELRGRDVTVNAVAPGPVATQLFLKGKSDDQVTELAKLPPLERLGRPEDIANVVSFLAGPDGGWVNSQVLRANGGFV